MNIIKIAKKSKLLKKIYLETQCKFYSFLTILSPTLNTKVRYRSIFRKKLDLKNPKTLNEKILWLKLNTYYRNPLVIQCADKYLVREYVSNCGLGQILVPLIGVWEDPMQIPWDDLPEQFVLKWNFGAGMNIICTDKSKINKEIVIKQLKEWKKCKYWLPYSEMQYKYINPKIVCEELLK